MNTLFKLEVSSTLLSVSFSVCLFSSGKFIFGKDVYIRRLIRGCLYSELQLILVNTEPEHFLSTNYAVTFDFKDLCSERLSELIKANIEI
jgi:hypothetical protein